ncbi:MAG TPA: hypothetical protein VL284_07470 [Thermoanaerobaculia bacterium]|nr:hypothetical protein [Thermoanaerobaculia bacterium]
MRISRRERGEGQFGCLVGLVLLAIAVFVAWKVIPLKVKAAEVRQTLVDEAKSAGMHNDDRIHRAIMEAAQEDNLPVKDDDIKINRGNNQITVTLDYVVPIEFPGYTYEWHVHNEQTNPIF